MKVAVTEKTGSRTYLNVKVTVTEKIGSRIRMLPYSRKRKGCAAAFLCDKIRRRERNFKNTKQKERSKKHDRI